MNKTVPVLLGIVAVILVAFGALLVALALNSEVPELASPNEQFTTVSVESGYGCGIRSDGRLKCWGEVGAPSGVYPQGRKPPMPEGTFVSVSVANDRACAARSDGAVVCWGANVEVPTGIERAAEVAASNGWTCARASPGAVDCWSTRFPGKVVRLPGTFQQLSRDSWGTWGDVCGVTTEGGMTCLVGGAATAIALEGTFRTVAFERDLACGLAVSGEMVCWSVGPRWRSSLLQPPSGTFTTLSVGYQSVCGIRSDGGALVCNAGHSGNKVAPPEGKFVAIASGGWTNCAVRETGSVVCWGQDPNPEFGFEGLAKPGIVVVLAGIALGALAAGTYQLGRRPS